MSRAVSTPEDAIVIAALLDASTLDAPCLMASPAKYQPNNLEAYCNILVNLSRPSNVSTQAIQFLIWKGDCFWERPVWRMERALLVDDDCVMINGDCEEFEEGCNSA